MRVRLNSHKLKRAAAPKKNKGGRPPSRPSASLLLSDPRFGKVAWLLAFERFSILLAMGLALPLSRSRRTNDDGLRVCGG